MSASRAFYGWLAYCRHLSTVRTHLSGLVMAKIITGDNASEGLTVKKWEEMKSKGVIEDSGEIYKLTYFGGVAHEIRKEVWPYLLGHYKFGSSENERTELYEQTRQAYENTMSEWLAVEAIVRQKDKENTAASIAKLSSESTSGENPPPAQLPRDLSNDVSTTHIFKLDLILIALAVKWGTVASIRGTVALIRDTFLRYLKTYYQTTILHVLLQIPVRRNLGIQSSSRIHQ